MVFLNSIKTFLAQKYSDCCLFITKINLRNTSYIMGNQIKMWGRPIIKNIGYLTIGNNVTIVSNSRFTALGVNHASIMRTMNSNAIIDIGADSGFSGVTICAMRSVKIGEGCLFGANAVIVDTDFHSLTIDNRRDTNAEIKSKEIEIGNNVFIGTNSIVLKGVSLGDNCVVGAGSVVTRSFPKNTVIAGNPAKRIKELQ